MATERRLIDANALIEKFRAHRDLFISAWNESREMPPKDKARVDELGMCIAETINAPTVDAVEVVRCKDCKHWNKDALACDTLPWVNSCEHANWYEDDFCSYGERRTE